MKKKIHLLFASSVALLIMLISCNSSAEKSTSTSSTNSPGNNDSKTASTDAASREDFKEGVDYIVYDRIRIMDKIGFASPAEAYSLLLPRGWTHESDIVWNNPGQSCNGTFKWLKAKSPDGKYSFEIMPDLVYTYVTDPQLQQFYMNSDQGSYCAFRQPVNAEQYLRTVFVADELGNPEIVKVSLNQSVIDQMKQANETIIQESRNYGTGNIQFDQTAINADLRWQDKSEGMVVLGVSTMETIVPNVYDGTSSKIFTSLITKRFVFKYPAGEAEQARQQFSVIMGGVRTNPWWNDEVNKFWKGFREKRHEGHIGRIRMMDAQTKAIAQATIAKGNERLKTMDIELRNWEATQSSQDRMHTNFIKTIREVENYRDETGKYEMVSGYNHAWSRGDGTTFVLSNNPNFNAASAFQDQNWKEMKKVND